MNSLFKVNRIGAAVVCAGLFAGMPLMAGTATPAADAAQDQEQYTNWVNLTLGGYMIGGDKAQFRQSNRSNGGEIFGGIQDAHYEKELAKGTALTIDGHALFDNRDYKVIVELSKVNLGYIRGGYTQFRTWYDENGGYLPSISAAYPQGQIYGTQNGNNDCALDRGDLWVELGLRDADLPEITVRYDHDYRTGEKDSTEWGTAYLGAPGGLPKKIMPTYSIINEKRDILKFEATKTVFGNTEVNLGMFYEHNSQDDSLNYWNMGNAGFSNATYSTLVNDLDVDVFNGHCSSVTRLNDSFWLTAGYSYTTMNSMSGGLAITSTLGNTYSFDPLHPLSTSFNSLNGASATDEHIINLSLMWVPMKDLTITPAVRVGVEDINSNAPFTVSGTNLAITGTNYTTISANHFNDVEESLDIRYNGIDNVCLYVRGDWEERAGDYSQSDVYGTRTTGAALTGTTGFNKFNQATGVDYLSQKYEVGANYYPLAHLNLSVQYYYKIENADYNWLNAVYLGGTAGVPKAGTNIGIISTEQFITNDVNARVTWHPINSLVLVSRYDFQYITLDEAGIGGATAPSSLVGDMNSAQITNHIFSESISWTPLPRLYLQAEGSFVFSQTFSPVSTVNVTSQTYTSPTVLNFDNNFITLEFDAGYVIDDKTDLRASYSYYRACDYKNNESVGVPYGAGAEQNTVSVGVTRKLAKNISMSLNYSYTCYNDQTSGNNNNYTANMISSGLQFKF